MKTTTGDLWTYPADWQCIPTNGCVYRGRLVMGAGVARQALDRFPGLDGTLGAMVMCRGNVPVAVYRHRLITFPTKGHWRDRSTLALVRESAERLATLPDVADTDRVVLPAVGCGLGGLTWDEVGPLLARILDDRFTAVL